MIAESKHIAKNMSDLLKQICLFMLLLGLITSCEKAELPVKLPPKPNDSIQLASVEMGDRYDKQIFINLENNQTVTVDNNSWDLYFNTDVTSSQVFINGGKGVLISTLPSLQFQPNVTTSSLKWRWDEACGYDDSLALSNWMNKQTKLSYDSVYIIDRGSYITDNTRYAQFKVVSVDALKYVLRIATINGSNEHDVIIPKDPTKTHVYFSFDNGGTPLNFEPPKDQWHFCFLRYRWIYYEFNPPLLYTVTGIFINTSQVTVAVDSTLNFYDITSEQCKNITYQNKRDAMGFEWKVYNFSTGKYVARNFVNYFIKPNNINMVYKLRFVDYYSSSGVKGSPKFEFQKVYW